MKVKIQFGVKQIVLLCVAVVLVVILAVANYYLDYYSLIIHRFMAGDSANVTRDEGADAAVRDVAAESMVLLKNDNDYLPKKDLKKVNLFGYGSTDNGFLLTGGGSGARPFSIPTPRETRASRSTLRLSPKYSRAK